MSVIAVVLILCLFAAGFVLVWKYVPGMAKNILLIVLGIGVVLFILAVAGVLGQITGARVG